MLTRERFPAQQATEMVHPIVRISFYLLLCSIPFEMPNRSFLPYELPNVAAAIFLFCALMQPRVTFARTPIALLLFFVWLYAFAVSTVYNGTGHPHQVLLLFILYIQGVLVCYTAFNLLRHDDVLRGALLSLGLACVIRALLPWVGIGNTVHHVQTGAERLTAFGQNANNSAMIFAAGLLALIGLAFAQVTAGRRGSLSRVVALASCAVIGVAIVQTGSRGGLASLASGLLVFAVGGQNALARARNLLVGLAGLAALAWVASHSPVMRNRIANAAETGNMAGRERIYPTLWTMFRQKPVFGWGPVNNKYELGMRLWEQQRRRRDSHNIVLELLSATGILAAVPFFLGVGACVWAAWRARTRPLGMLPLALMTSLLAANMSGNWIAGKLFWVILAYALASACPIAGIDEQSSGTALPDIPGASPSPLAKARGVRGRVASVAAARRHRAC